MNENILSWKDFSAMIPPFKSKVQVDTEWQRAVKQITQKIVVLDDDPTGIQTIHNLPVYTSWNLPELKKILKDKHHVVYILTNSRALTFQKTQELHQQLIKDLNQAAREMKRDFLIISRSDSTLRGHFPLETKVLCEGLNETKKIDGEIIIPFFLEGGRFTVKDIHYVKENDLLIPVGKTEFARDSVFGFQASNLKEWIEEKTNRQFASEKIKSISLEMLRRQDIEGILNILLKISDFNKIIVNAVAYDDLKVFAIALAKSIVGGKNFIFRTAASFVRVIGGIAPRALLNAVDLYFHGRPDSPGLVIIGSYVQKTNRQINKLKELADLFWIEMDIHCVFSQKYFHLEVKRIIVEIEKAFSIGKDVCVYTSRSTVSIDGRTMSAEKYLNISSSISKGLTKVVEGIKIKPSFLLAKGGITSSDIGVQALKVKKAIVMGQIQPGIPVWRTGRESRFPGLPFVIFPGNVGSDDTLKKTLEILRGE